jgi:hypothetical protein
MTRHAIHAALLAMMLTGAAKAQGLNAEGAIDTIVGSEVYEQESSATADPSKIVAAIDKAQQTADAVRKVTTVASVEIVFLTDSAATDGGPPAAIQAKLKERQTEVGALRQELEGNALLFHAIDSKQVLMRDVLAVEIGTDQKVVVYAAGKPASQPVPAAD